MSGSERHSRTHHVHSITDAAEAASIESRQRFISYSIKMALRLVFFVAGAIIAVTWNLWVGLVLLGISAILPWVAVMGANLVRPPEQFMADEYGTTPQTELTPEPEQGPESTVIDGSWEPDPEESPVAGPDEADADEQTPQSPRRPRDEKDEGDA